MNQLHSLTSGPESTISSVGLPVRLSETTNGTLRYPVGVYCWFNILFAKAGLASSRSDQLEGAGWYQRGTRAHANLIENLPVFGAIV